MDKKIVLLTPPLSEIERFGDLVGTGAIMPGLGILSIAGCLRAVNFSVSIVDAEGRGWGVKTTVDELVKLSPTVLGITSTTLSFFSAVQVAEAVKKILPDIVIVFGGPHVTAIPQEAINSSLSIDAVILGDGEESFTRLVGNIRDGFPLYQEVDGLVWREGEKIITTPKTRHVKDLDKLPLPAWDLLDEFPSRYRPPFHSYRQLPVVNIITARGCPNVCSFCDRSVFGRICQSHSPEYVVDMIEHLIQTYGVREISIKDDMFILSRKRVTQFCNLLLERNIKITWSCNARVNVVTDEMLALMKKAGCWLISYGIESGSPEILKKMVKGITKEQVVNALKLTRKHGVTSKGFFLVGIPGETEETLNETVEFIKSLPLDELSINYFTPFPGSQLYEEVVAEGFKPDFRKMSMQEISYMPETISKKALKQVMDKIIFKFYLRPHKLLIYAGRGITNFQEFKRVLRMVKIFFRLLLAKSSRKKVHPVNE